MKYKAKLIKKSEQEIVKDTKKEGASQDFEREIKEQAKKFKEDKKTKPIREFCQSFWTEIKVAI